MNKSDFTSQKQYRSVRFVKNYQLVGSSRGELILELSGGVTIDPQAISRAVWHFNNSPDAQAVSLASQPYFYPSEPHLFTTYHLLINALINKSKGIFGHIHIDQATIIMWRRASKSIDTSSHAIYADDAVATHLPISNLSVLLKMQHLKNSENWFTQLYAAMVFLALSYCLYQATLLHQTTLLGLALLCFTLFMIIAIWWNNNLSWNGKFLYSLLLPVSLGYFSILLVLNTLKFLAYVAKAIVPISISLFVRVKNILRIVE